MGRLNPSIKIAWSYGVDTRNSFVTEGGKIESRNKRKCKQTEGRKKGRREVKEKRETRRLICKN